MARRIDAGFTLFELSLVLVIIALIAGAIMVGRTLLRASEMQTVQRQYAEFITAYRTFQSKYNCIAGDCKNATQVFGTSDHNCPITPDTVSVTGTCDGDGSGYYDDGGTLPLENEALLAWQQLADSGLIAGSYMGALHSGGAGYDISGTVGASNYQAGYNCPPILSSAHCWLWADIATEAIYIPIIPRREYRTALVMWPMNGTWTSASNWSPFISNAFAMPTEPDGSDGPPYSLPPFDWSLPDPPLPSGVPRPGMMLFTPEEALEYDSKFDDGSPVGGNVQAQSGYYINGCTTTQDANAQYDLSQTSPNCGFFYLPRL